MFPLSIHYTVFGAFAKMRKATIIFVISVCPHVTTRFHWTDFHEILYLNIFRKSAKKIQFSCILCLCDSPFYEFYVPTFRNTLLHFHISCEQGERRGINQKKEYKFTTRRKCEIKFKFHYNPTRIPALYMNTNTHF
jgi:hypothetical protein